MNASIPSVDEHAIAHALGLVVLCVLVVPFVVYAVPGVVGGAQSYVVLSGSMEPAISVGDVVVVAEWDPATLDANDVITYSRGAEVPTTHRIVEVVETDDGVAFQTKGDANEDPDPGLVRQSQVIGAVIVTIPFLGYVVEFVGTPLGFALLVLVPFGLLGILEVRDWITGRRGAEAEGLAETGAIAETTPGETADALEDARRGSDGSVSQDRTAGGFTASRGDLTIGIAAFGLFGAYAAYVTYLLRSPWSAAVTAGTVGLALLLAAVRSGWFGLPDESPSTDGGIDPAAGRVVPGTVALPDRTPTVSVESLATLRAIASVDDRWIVRDAGRSYVFDRGTVYACDTPQGTGAFDDTDTRANGLSVAPKPGAVDARNRTEQVEGDDDER